MNESDCVHIESGGAVGNTTVTYKGHIMPVESITFTLDVTTDDIARATFTVPAAVMAHIDLPPDVVEFIESHKQDPKPED